MINPLIASPSPRDIPWVKEAMDKIHSDKIFAKYMDEWLAYKRLREFFLNYKQYTHLVICPDDLVVTSDVFEQLRKRIEDNPEWPILAGICNLTWYDQDMIAACWNAGGHQFISMKEVERMLKDGIGPVIEVGHEGFACTWIRRDVLEKIDLRGEHWEMDGMGRSFDYGFFRQCVMRKIPIRIDLTCKMTHYSNHTGDGTLEYSGKGLHPQEMRYQSDDITPYETSEYAKESYNPIISTMLYDRESTDMGLLYYDERGRRP